MTIDEAIIHANEKAKEQRYYASFEKNNLMYQSCLKCAEEHEQLAKWLGELKVIKEYIEPLRRFNTHNEHLEKLKELVSQTEFYHIADIDKMVD